MASLGCEKAKLVSALSDGVSGTSNILAGIFQFPEEFTVAAFGSNPNLGVNETASGMPPIAYNGMPGVLECRQRCSLNGMA